MENENEMLKKQTSELQFERGSFMSQENKFKGEISVLLDEKVKIDQIINMNYLTRVSLRSK